MSNSASLFANPIFRSATFAFKVATDDFVIDERGNKKSSSQEVLVTFYVRGSGGSSRTRQEGGATGTSTYSVIVVAVNHLMNKKLPSSINVGDVGVGTINGRDCTAKIENLTQSSVMAVQEALGDRVQISVNFKVREGVSG